MKYLEIFLLVFVMKRKECDSVMQWTMVPNGQISVQGSTEISLCVRLCLAQRKGEAGNSVFFDCLCQLVNGKVAPSFLDLDIDNECVFFDISSQINEPVGFPEAFGFRSLGNPVNKKSDMPRQHKNVVKESSFKVTLPLVCAPGFLPQGVAMCRNNATCFTLVCASVSSCSMVKQYQSDSEDGEYWLRLTNFDNYVTRIYCHNMSTPTPREYLTLRYPNHGIYPLVSNYLCTGEYELAKECANRSGEIWFFKVRVDIHTMEVLVDDRTFANDSTVRNTLRYGVAEDCYTSHEGGALKCGTRGKFTIDLRGTGWRIGTGQEWETYGWQSMVEKIDNQMNGTLVELKCGGFNGGCGPKNGLFFHPWPHFTRRS